MEGIQIPIARMGVEGKNSLSWKARLHTSLSSCITKQPEHFMLQERWLQALWLWVYDPFCDICKLHKTHLEESLSMSAKNKEQSLKIEKIIMYIIIVELIFITPPAINQSKAFHFICR